MRVPRYLKGKDARFYFKRLVSRLDESNPVDEFLLVQVAEAMAMREKLSQGNNLEKWRIDAMYGQQQIISDGLRGLGLYGKEETEEKPEFKLTNYLNRMEIR